ncbi:MAG: PQQ-binding-like beta-propeller repeat protein [Pirellulaceae bacterium]
MRFRFYLAHLALALSASPLAAWAAAPEANWPTFRGVGRTAVSPDTGLLQSWPDAGPPLVWEAAGVGRGYSSLAIADGRIYTLGDGLSTTPDDKEEYLTCLNLADGKPLWKTKTGPAWNEGKTPWQGSRSTPTVDGERVYVVTPHGKLVCCGSAGGSLLWQKDLKQDFGGKKGDGWGYSESVLIDGGKVVCTPGGEKATLVALDKLTGEPLWQTDRPGNRGAGHSSIVMSRIGETPVYVQSTASGPMGVQADNGKLLWTYDIDRTTAVIPTPIVRGELVFFTAGYGRGGALLKQVAGKDGAIEVEEIYPLQTELGNKHGGVVLVGDHLYGDSEDRGMPFSAELLTGEVQWKERVGGGSAAVAAADGHLYFRFADGTMRLVEANPEAYKAVGQFKIPGSGDLPSWSHPVIAGGRLYLREGDKLLCYELKAE